MRINWKVSYRCFSVWCTELQMLVACLASLLPRSYVILIIATLTWAVVPLLLVITLDLRSHARLWLSVQLCFLTSTLPFREINRHLPMSCFVLWVKQSSTRYSSWQIQYKMRPFVRSVSNMTDYIMLPTNNLTTSLVMQRLMTPMPTQWSSAKITKAVTVRHKHVFRHNRPVRRVLLKSELVIVVWHSSCVRRLFPCLFTD